MLEGGTVTTSLGLEGTGWPRRVRLRTRLGKRCRKDLTTGRAGILIKATFNPLEGDSSGAKASQKGGGGDPSICLIISNDEIRRRILPM